jgi:hypothetical protein
VGDAEPEKQQNCAVRHRAALEREPAQLEPYSLMKLFDNLM